jgi:hypothetical protein
MPSNEEHSLSTLENHGQLARELHRWMDELWKIHGENHRRYRHNPDQPPEWAVDIWGRELTQKLMRDHIKLDRRSSREKIGYQTEDGIIDEDESIVYYLKNKDTDFIVTNQQLRVLKNDNIVNTLLLSDIDHIQVDTRKQPIGLTITIMLLGILSLIWFRLVDNSFWFLGLGVLLTMVGFFTFFNENEVLIISQRSTSTRMEFVINTSKANIDNFILKISELN